MFNMVMVLANVIAASIMFGKWQHSIDAGVSVLLFLTSILWITKMQGD
jgi:hypothetical protein